MKISHANAALLLAALAAGTAAAQSADKSPLVAVPKTAPQTKANGADADFTLVQEHCSGCHSLDQVTSATKSADEWSATIDRMVDHGMQISPEDSQRVSAYLAQHYGPKPGS